MRKPKPRFLIHTLGCKVNQYDSEKMRTHLLRQGYASLQGEEPADLIIVNTCSVTAESDRKGRQTIRKLIRRHPQAKVMVTGCYAERFPDQVESIPGIDSVVAIPDQEHWLREFMEDMGWGCEEQAALWDTQAGIETFFEHTRAFLKIQDGCDQKCTYCSIPLSRGPARSRRIEDILPEAEQLTRRGYPEIVICGICLGHFGLDTGETLAELLRRMVRIDGLRRIRISSFEPQNLTDALFQTMAEHGDVICPHLHLPLQSGSDTVLRRMKRPYSYAYFKERIEKARSLMPQFEVSTDIMVGFPGETEQDFACSLQAIRECQFTKVHSFRFSAREDTPAARLSNHIPKKEVESRRKKTDAVAREVSDKLKQKYIHSIFPILVETKEDKRWVGFTPNYIRTLFESKEPVKKGGIIPVAIHQLVDGRFLGIRAD